jgi:hypothetical protein
MALTAVGAEIRMKSSAPSMVEWSLAHDLDLIAELENRQSINADVL